MSPFGATTTADGALNSSGPSPATPALPNISSTFPSGLNLNTWWPVPSLPNPSVTHTLPSRSTVSPCGKSRRPPPKLFTSVPEASNLRIGGRFEPSQANGVPGFISEGGANAPQRSATHTLVPSGSIPTPLVEPQLRPSGSFAQFSTDR